MEVTVSEELYNRACECIRKTYKAMSKDSTSDFTYTDKDVEDAAKRTMVDFIEKGVGEYEQGHLFAGR